MVLGGASEKGLPKTGGRNCVPSLLLQTLRRGTVPALGKHWERNSHPLAWKPRGCHPKAVLLVFFTQSHLFPPSYQADGFNTLWAHDFHMTAPRSTGWETHPCLRPPLATCCSLQSPSACQGTGGHTHILNDERVSRDSLHRLQDEAGQRHPPAPRVHRQSLKGDFNVH